MAMSDLVRAAIVAQLNAIDGIGRVHAYQRYAADMGKMAELYKAEDGQLRGWLVRRGTVAEKKAGSKHIETVRWTLQGFMALADANQTELLFDSLVDTIREQFRDNRTLGIAGLTTIGEDAAGVQVDESEPVLFANVLCHSAKLSLTTERFI